MELINAPAFYFPLANGRYEVSAGFSRLDKDFGNGPVDRQVFQFDNTFTRYRNNKLACRGEELAKYYREQNLRPELARELSVYLIKHLCAEHPDKFQKSELNNNIELRCGLTGETLIFDATCTLQSVKNAQAGVSYVSVFDAIACQVQEDLAVVQLNETSDFLCALHLCSPNHWAAEDKIGTSFIETHRPVPQMEKISQQADNLFRAILQQGPYVRFAWGLATDSKLNHHPLPPSGVDVSQWQGRQFNPDRPELWLRIERQTLTGIKSENAILFTIRTYFYNIKHIANKSDYLSKIRAALNSMSNETLIYKGVDHSKHDILKWLDSIQ